MEFPLSITATINTNEGDIYHDLELRGPLTFIIGPNGSGKTHLLKGLKNSFSQYTDKKARFLSAGRLGPLERYRSKVNRFFTNTEDITFGNKEDSKYRHEIESIYGDLHTLYKRPDILIKVRERLQKLFKRDIYIDWDAGDLKVYFSRIGDENSYSAGREASGLLHLVGILSALYDDEVGVLLIDEPEVSLHPQLQAFLLKEIIQTSGVPSDSNYKKIIIIATHSVEMIKISKVDDLLSLVFCNNLSEKPIQIPVDAGELKNNNLKSLVSRLGQEHKLSLFSKKPLLVEGPSDVIICNALSDKLELYLEAAGSQILPINGKQAMPETVKLLRLMGKEPIVLADADVFADGTKLIIAFFNNDLVKEKADKLVARSGVSILELSRKIYDNFCSAVNDHWSDISKCAELHPYYNIYKIEDTEENKMQRKRRSALCSLFTHEELTPIWDKIKNQLVDLFDVFQECGLFILKNGAIESYYEKKLESLEEKLNSSIIESEYILSISVNDNEIRSRYQDVVNCLSYAANNVVVDESKGIRKELLSFVSPIYAEYSEGEVDLSTFNKDNTIFSCHVNEDEKLEVLMNSTVLDTKGFPIILEKGEDVIRVVNKHLGLK